MQKKSSFRFTFLVLLNAAIVIVATVGQSNVSRAATVAQVNVSKGATCSLKKSSVSPSPISDLARNVAVRIEIKRKGGIGFGSGVIIAKKAISEKRWLYTVLTADHVLFETPIAPLGSTYVFDSKFQDDKTYAPVQLMLITPNGMEECELQKADVIRLRDDSILGVDMALVKFESSEEYTVATLKSTTKPLDLTSVYGWPGKTNGITDGKLSNGVILGLGEIDYLGHARKGYTMRYNASTARGMSGGPVFDETGKYVIGLHGLSADPDPLTESPQIDLSGAFAPSKQFIAASRGIPINVFLDQIPGGKLNSGSNSFFANIDKSLVEGRQAPGVAEIAQPSDTNPYVLGIKSFAKKDYSAAITALQAAITSLDQQKEKAANEEDKNQINKQIGLIHVVIGDAYHKLGNDKDAKAQYTLAQSLGESTNLEATIHQVSIDSDNKDYKSAEKVLTDKINSLEKLEDEVNTPPILYLLRARFRGTLGTPKATAEKQEDINRAKQLAIVKNDRIALVAVGIFLRDQTSDLEKAFEVWEKAVLPFDQRDSTDKGDMNSYLEIGSYLNRIGRSEDALKFWKRLSDNYPTNPDVQRRLSIVYEQFKYKDEAFKKLDDAITLQSKTPEGPKPEIFEQAAETRSRFSDKGKAVEYWKQARDLYIAEKRYPEANAIAKKLCSASPSDCPSLTEAVKPPATNGGTNLPQQSAAFICERTSNQTILRREGSSRVMITWKSAAFAPNYPSDLRCRQVSERLERYEKNHRLSSESITYGTWSPGYTALCLRDEATAKCARDGLILTLEKDENPDQKLREFQKAIKAITSGSNITPLLKSLPKPE